MRPEEQKASVKAAVRVGALGGVLYGAVSLLGAVLATMPLAALVAQTVATEWGMGKLGLAWSNPLEPERETKEIAARVAKGALIGMAPAAIVLEWLHLTHTCDIFPASFGVTSLLLGLLSAALGSVRDQILLVGLTRRVLAHADAAWPKVLAGGALFAARAYGAEATPFEIAATFALGALGAALWQRDRAAYAAVGMNLGWLFTTETLFHGTLLEVRTLPSALSGGDAGMGHGLAAAAVLGLCAAGALFAPARGAAPRKKA